MVCFSLLALKLLLDTQVFLDIMSTDWGIRFDSLEGS